MVRIIQHNLENIKNQKTIHIFCILFAFISFSFIALSMKGFGLLVEPMFMASQKDRLFNLRHENYLFHDYALKKYLKYVKSEKEDIFFVGDSVVRVHGTRAAATYPRILNQIAASLNSDIAVHNIGVNGTNEDFLYTALLQPEVHESDIIIPINLRDAYFMRDKSLCDGVANSGSLYFPARFSRSRVFSRPGMTPVEGWLQRQLAYVFPLTSITNNMFKKKIRILRPRKRKATDWSKLYKRSKANKPATTTQKTERNLRNTGNPLHGAFFWVNQKKSDRSQAVHFELNPIILKLNKHDVLPDQFLQAKTDVSLKGQERKLFGWNNFEPDFIPKFIKYGHPTICGLSGFFQKISNEGLSDNLYFTSLPINLEREIELLGLHPSIPYITRSQLSDISDQFKMDWGNAPIYFPDEFFRHKDIVHLNWLGNNMFADIARRRSPRLSEELPSSRSFQFPDLQKCYDNTAPLAKLVHGKASSVRYRVGPQYYEIKSEAGEKVGFEFEPTKSFLVTGNADGQQEGSSMTVTLSDNENNVILESELEYKTPFTVSYLNGFARINAKSAKISNEHLSIFIGFPASELPARRQQRLEFNVVQNFLEENEDWSFDPRKFRCTSNLESK